MLYAPTYRLFASPTPIPRTPWEKASGPTYTYSYQWQELLSSGWTKVPHQTRTGRSQISLLSFSVAERVLRVKVTRTIPPVAPETAKLSPGSISYANPDVYCRNLYTPLESIAIMMPDSASYMPDSCHRSQPSTTPITTTATSSPIAVAWRPALVEITSTSPAYLESGDENKRTVTLTATASAPPGTTYQWQRRSGTAWTNLGTAGASLTKSATFTTRGTREFRVVAAYNAMGRQFSATSQPLHATWDEWAIVSDMLTALQTQVTSDAAYTNAQTALVSCMNGGSGTSDSSTSDSVSSATTTPSTIGDSTLAPTPTPTPTPTPFTSFDDILSKYTGATKAKMDSGGACHTQAETMFTTTQTLSRSKLATLKRGNAEYARLLETAHGRYFERNIGNKSILKQVSFLSATDTIAPGSLETPLYKPKTSGSAAPQEIPALGTGFDCLPAGVDGTRMTLKNKMVVLSCLVLSTPHSFWQTNANALKDDKRFNTWLAYGDWECTFWVDISYPTCRKHDVVFASLQKFAGPTEGTVNGDEMDEAWNPRNKFLADNIAYNDIKKYNCDDPSDEARRVGLCAAGPTLSAAFFNFGISKINTKTWPLTDQDITHAEKTIPEFISCAPPKATNISLTKRNDWTFQVNWGYDPGCVRDITVDRYRLVWEVEVPNLGGLPGTRVEKYLPKLMSGNASSDRFMIPLLYTPFWRSVTVSIEIRPNDIAYGGLLGFENLFGNPSVASLILPLGVYYDKQYSERITR